jgi:hypothetical protein
MVPTVERGLRLVVFCSMEREGFDVAALAFGVDGVEGEGGLAGAGEAGDHGESVARDADVDVAQIVLARAADGDVCDAHVRGMAMFGQVSRIRHVTGREISVGGKIVLGWATL